MRENIVLSLEDFGILAIHAIHYSMGRRTYMPSLVRSIVLPNLRSMRIQDLNSMEEDCISQEKNSTYGDDFIDKPGWVKWKNDVETAIVLKHSEKNDLKEISLSEEDAGTLVICAVRDAAEMGLKKEKTGKIINAAVKLLDKLSYRDIYVLQQDLSFHDHYYFCWDNETYHETKEIMESAWNPAVEKAYGRLKNTV